jgi:hypothetical protein
MKSLAFANYSDVPLTLIGLGLFIAVFSSWVIWVCLHENRVYHEKIAKHILEEGERQ